MKLYCFKVNLTNFVKYVKILITQLRNVLRDQYLIHKIRITNNFFWE